MVISKEDFEASKRIADIFLSLNREEKIQSLAYMSALRDRQELEKQKNNENE